LPVPSWLPRPLASLAALWPSNRPYPTRAQVLAELAEAKRTGELVSTSGGTIKKLNEFFPN